MTGATMHPLTAARGPMTVADLASRAGVYSSTIALIEAGISQRPQASTIAKLAKALGIEATQLERDLFEWHQARKAAA